MPKLRLLLCVLLLLTFSAGNTLRAAPSAQTLPGTISLVVEAGYDGYFRENQWLPLIIRARNDGVDVAGRLVVRPETSSDAVTNTFSTPVSLPSGAQQTIFLYVTARSFASQLRVELIDANGFVVAAQPASVQAVQPRDSLYVVLTESAAGSLDLTGARFGNANAYQANWAVADVPDRASALDAVDVIVFTDVDTGALSTAQRRALAEWVTAGGHLVVTGGPNWQGTAAGLGDLLPFQPSGTATLESLAPLGEWLAVNDNEVRALDAASVVSTGTLTERARALVTADDNLPLLVRHTVGDGTVDYLTADPNTQPLRGWGRLPDLWYTLQATRASTPGWSHGFGNWDQAARAVEILPGFDPLPDILPLFGFLAAYIVLIGPINYLILNRINRREWAWITIPVLILIFSIASWQFGSNLRGNEAILNRLAVVQTWPGSSAAQVDGLVGLLSPRRTQYTLVAQDAAVLRPIPRAQLGGSALTGSAQTSIDIRQTQQFEATEFTVDASFVAGFNLSGMVDKPAFGGSASIAYDPSLEGQQTVRGTVRNDSDNALYDPVILARGQALRLNSPLQPGDVVAFDLTLPGEGAPSASPYVAGATLPYFSSRFAYSTNLAEQSAIDILGPEHYDMNLIRSGANVETVEQQTRLRQQWLLSAIVNDSFRSTGRGDNVYLAGWVEQSPLPVELAGANWNAQTSTVYLIALDTQIVHPAQAVTIPAERFMWSVREFNGTTEIAPVDLNMQPGETVVFRFTPLPTAVLDDVTELHIRLSDLNVGGRAIPLSLWDWKAEAWTVYEAGREGLVIDDYARFLGPENAVQIRLAADDTGGYMRIGQLGVEQVGTFAAD